MGGGAFSEMCGIILVTVINKRIILMMTPKYSDNKFLQLAFAVFFLSFLIQCKKDLSVADNSGRKGEVQSPQNKDSIQQQDAVVKTKIKYSSFIFPTKKRDSAMADFNKRFSEKEQYAILALNRLDAKNKWRADTLAIPDKVDTTLMMYSPFPSHLEILKDVKKIAVFSYPVQAYALYEKGNLIKWGPTSMGKKAAQTKRGLMFANWKKELAISTVNSSWKLPYNVNVHNTLGIGWHQFDLPGFPASHSCLRLLMADAKYMYQWVDTWLLNKGGATVRANGTPVIVFGDYNWGGKKPWKQLIQNADADQISAETLNTVIEPHISKILEEQKKREQALSSPEASEVKIPAA